MDHTSVLRAFSLWEICIDILGRVDRTALARVARTTRVFSPVALELLWRDAPAAPLIRLAPERRSHYAPMVRALVLNPADRIALTLTPLPALRQVTLAAEDFTAPEGAVDFLQQYGGQLHAVHAQAAGNGLLPPLGLGVVNTLADMPLLSKLFITSLPLPLDAIMTLLGRPAEATFPRLEGLQAHLPSAVAPALLARMTSLTLVRARIAGDADGNVLPVAAELRALKILDIVFLDNADLQGTQL
jgi:hypothetical protein